MCTGKSDEDYVEIKLCRDPTSGKSDLYKFKHSLFGHGDPEEFLLFVCNSKMTLMATGILEVDAKIHYLRTLFRGEALHQFELLSANVENMDTLNLYYYINCLASYFTL